MFVILSEDDAEHWPIVQRAILIAIEVSELVSYSHPPASSSDQTDDKTNSQPQPQQQQLVNAAFFDYLAEKTGQLCYERACHAKKAACQLMSLLAARMPLGWLFAKLPAFVRSLLYVLVAVSGEISSGVIELAQRQLT